MTRILLVFWVIILLVALVFFTLNAVFVPLNYYFGTLTIYLPLLLFLSLVVGLCLGLLVLLPYVIKAKCYKSKKKLT